MMMNIARLFTKAKPKFKLFHDLCSCSTLFLGLCETFLFDGISDCEIHIPDFTELRCDRFSREGGGVCIYLRNSRVGNSLLLGHCPFGLEVTLIFKDTEASWEDTKATFHPSPGASKPV